MCPTHSINRRPACRNSGATAEFREHRAWPQCPAKPRGTPALGDTESASTALRQPSHRAPAPSCKTDTMPRLSEPSPYVEIDRRQWRALRMSTPLAPKKNWLACAVSVSRSTCWRSKRSTTAGPADSPASRRPPAAVRGRGISQRRLTKADRPVPFIIGVAGGVAVASPPPPRAASCWLAGIHHPG